MSFAVFYLNSHASAHPLGVNLRDCAEGGWGMAGASEGRGDAQVLGGVRSSAGLFI